MKPFDPDTRTPDTDGNCPRCHSRPAQVRGLLTNDTDHTEFSCGSWWDKYSSPFWSDECYRAQGIDGLAAHLASELNLWRHCDENGRDVFHDKLTKSLDAFAKELKSTKPMPIEGA